MSIFYLFLGLIIGVIIYQTVIKSLYIYYVYKRRYGKDVIILFFPVIGWYYFVNQSFKKYGDSHQFYKTLIKQNPNAKAILALSGFSNILTILDTNWVMKCLTNQHLFFKRDGPFGFDLLFGEGLLFKNKQEWKNQRAFLQGNFHFSALMERFQMLKDCNLQFCSEVPSNGEYVKLDYYNEAAKVSSDIISHSFMGRSINEIQVNSKSFSIELINLVKDCFIYRITNPYFMLKASIFGPTKSTTFLNSSTENTLLSRIESINSSLYKIIEEREQQLKKQFKTHNEMVPANFLDIYLKEIWKQEEENKEQKSKAILTRKEIVNQYTTVIFAGTDTTSHLIGNILFELSRNPDVYQRLQKEIDDNIPSFENMKYEDLNNLPYLRLVIKETQRLYPAIFYLFGRFMEKDYTDDDLYISKDLEIQIRLVSQQEKQSGLFSDIQKFNPDRYNSTDKEDPYDFIPFSAGPRNCIGQYLALIETKLAIVYALKKFNLKKREDYELKMFQEFVYSPVEKDLFYIKKK
ncbi:hypothetical protein ABPG72_022761 [Tetrahymena utriculariae]